MTSTSRLRDTEDTPKDNRGVFGVLPWLLPDETALTGSRRRLRREPVGREEERGAPGRVRGQSRTPMGPATESCQWLDGTSDMLGWGGRRARGMERRTCWAGTRAASSPHGSSEVFGRVPRTSPSSSSGAPSGGQRAPTNRTLRTDPAGPTGPWSQAASPLFMGRQDTSQTSTGPEGKRSSSESGHPGNSEDSCRLPGHLRPGSDGRGRRSAGTQHRRGPAPLSPGGRRIGADPGL